MENCKICWWLLPLIVIVFTFWVFSWSKWVVLVAALILLWMGFGGKCCTSKTSAPVKKKK